MPLPYSTTTAHTRTIAPRQQTLRLVHLAPRDGLPVLPSPCVIARRSNDRTPFRCAVGLDPQRPTRAIIGAIAECSKGVFFAGRQFGHLHPLRRSQPTVRAAQSRYRAWQPAQYATLRSRPRHATAGLSALATQPGSHLLAQPSSNLSPKTANLRLATIAAWSHSTATTSTCNLPTTCKTGITKAEMSPEARLLCRSRKRAGPATPKPNVASKGIHCSSTKTSVHM